MKPTLLLAALCAAALTTLPAHAHGDKPHAPAGDVVYEQTVWGIAANPARVQRTLTVDMTDTMRFTPDRLTVKEGETIRFIVRNRGRMVHEMVIGTPDELARHAAMMAKFPDMEHDAPYMVHVDPGKTGEIVWHFNRPGQFEFACLIAGHYEAGMRGTLVVEPAVPPASMSEAVVRKIDVATGRLTLKHGPIENLDMPPMTMVFRVQNPAALGVLKPGDAIRFRAERIDGAFVVTDWQRAP